MPGWRQPVWHPIRIQPAPLDLREDHLLDSLDRGFVALVESPLLDALAADEAGANQNIQVVAGGGLADGQLARDEHAANAVLHQIAVHLRREMLARILQPIEN